MNLLDTEGPKASRVGVTSPVGILEPAAKSEPDIPIGEVQVEANPRTSLLPSTGSEVSPGEVD